MKLLLRSSLISLAVLFMIAPFAVRAQELDADALFPVIVGIAADSYPQINQTGILVSASGLILTTAGDVLLDIYESDPDALIDVQVFRNGDAGSPIWVKAGFAAEIIEKTALLQIASEDGTDTASLTLSYYEPIIHAVTPGFLESIYNIAYSSVGARGIIVTEASINTTLRVEMLMSSLKGSYYGTRITIDSTGTGGLVVNSAGDFLGLVSLAGVNNQLSEIIPLGTVCLENLEICRLIVESNRPAPANRQTPPAGLWQLTDGVGRSTGGRVSNGQVEMDYYCRMIGMTTQLNEAESEWRCVDGSDTSPSFPLMPIHHDIICQQTYRTSDAVAFQMNIVGASPAQSWRCYG